MGLRPGEDIDRCPYCGKYGCLYYDDPKIEHPKKLVRELEGLLIPIGEWDTCGAPEQAVSLAREEHLQGVPTGISKHPTEGWFVIQSSGQGPYIIWTSN